MALFLKGGPFPATASAEGRLIKGGPFLLVCTASHAEMSTTPAGLLILSPPDGVMLLRMTGDEPR
jgi:hypothetical protein